MKYITRDYEGFRTEMIKKLKEKLPDYTDTSSTDAGIVLIELFAHMLDILSYYLDIVANEVFFDTAKERGSIIAHAKLFGYKISGVKPAKIYQVFEIIPQPTDYVIPKGFRVRTKRTVSEDPIFFETDEDLVIPAGCTGLEQDENGDYLYKVSATHGYTVNEDVIGTSDGTPNQKFKLNFAPVIEDSITVYVNEGDGYVKWRPVDNFINSSYNSPHYEINLEEDDSVVIAFGDGVAGKIPVTYPNGIIASYRVGGGIIGNVGENTVVEVDKSVAEIKRTFNPEPPYQLGEESEDVESAKRRAVARIRSLWRAVTLKDFEDLAISELPVLKAKALYDEETGITIVKLLPKNADTFTPEELNEILAFYRERKLINAIVSVENPDYVELNLKLVVKVFARYSTEIEKIRNEIDNIIRNEFFARGNYDFGQSFIASEIMARLLQVEGVKSVYIYEITESGEEIIMDKDIKAYEILKLSPEYDKETNIVISV